MQQESRCNEDQDATRIKMQRGAIATKPDFATKQRMFGLLTIDEGPPLSMTVGRAVAQHLVV